MHAYIKYGRANIKSARGRIRRGEHQTFLRRENFRHYRIHYKAHYYANHRAFFILFALFVPVDIVDSLLKGVPHFLVLGPIYFVSSVVYFAGLITAALTRSQRFHEFDAVFFLIQTTVGSFLIFQTLV